MRQHYDIKRISESGTLVLPLSQSKLHGTQGPEAIYTFLKRFSNKIHSLSVDVVILYTSSLYFNSEEISLNLKTKTTNQMVQHRAELSKKIDQRREFIPQAIHYLPWDYVILNSDKYFEFFTELQLAYKKKHEFRASVEFDLKDRGVTDANIKFVLEELAVTHLIRQNFVNFPATLSKPNGWKLIAYPGDSLTSDLYLYKNQLLPLNALTPNKGEYSRGLYNYEKDYLIDFKYMSLPQ